MKTYPMEDQLISIAAVTPLILDKDPWDMSEEEIEKAEVDALEYVHWIEAEDTAQYVPALLGSNTEIPVFAGTYEDLQRKKTA